jgi:protocatechuate 3,4-dioxygenase beta subunit
MPTPHQILGPYFPVATKPAARADLTTIEGRKGRAEGEVIEVRGRVLNRDGMPVEGAKLVIWQANSFGRYRHPNDTNAAPLDENFDGFAEIVSGSDGTYRIKTVKPGAYPAGPDWTRPPHVHFEVVGKFERLITQMYFAGEPLNTSDRFLTSVSDPELLIAAPVPDTGGVGSSRIWRFDIVLDRG